MSDIQVQSVETAGDYVQVHFADGYLASFRPYAHGWGYQVEGLQHFLLYHDKERLCRYDGRLYYSGLQDDEHKLKFLADGWTQERVATYWKAARDYCNEQFMNKSNEQLWYPWKLVCTEGGSDFERLSQGKAVLYVER